MSTTISIIVPCYNSAEYLRETLDCLQKQTLNDWECIIVNDGSTDNSLDIIKEYARKDSRYHYINKTNEGPSIARNIAIAASSGKYILPLDADDIIDSKYAEISTNYLDCHPEVKVVYGIAEYFGNKTGVWELPEYSYEGMLWENSIFCTAVYRRSDFLKTNGYNPNMLYGNEDWDFWLSFLSKEDKVYKIPATMLWYRKHGKTRTTDTISFRNATYRQMILNHFDRYNPFLGKLIELNETNKYLNNEIARLINSRTYRIGRILLKPINTLFGLTKQS